MKVSLIFSAALLFASIVRAAYLPSQEKIVTFTIPAVAVLTTGSAADLASIVLPTRLTRYAVQNVYVTSVTAAGTLAAATIDLRTAAAGGGSSILTAATALTGLTTLNLAQSVSAAAIGVTYTAGTIYLRQTVDSLSAGTIMIVVVVVDLSS